LLENCLGSAKAQILQGQTRENNDQSPFYSLNEFSPPKNGVEFVPTWPNATIQRADALV
jgi:hypothetical protein